VEFLDEDWGQWRNSEGRENADEDEDCLVDNDYCFPCRTPVL
jgi:hypothetical protein